VREYDEKMVHAKVRQGIFFFYIIFTIIILLLLVFTSFTTCAMNKLQRTELDQRGKNVKNETKMILN